jgi:hypothetical protein
MKITIEWQILYYCQPDNLDGEYPINAKLMEVRVHFVGFFLGKVNLAWWFSFFARFVYRLYMCSLLFLQLISKNSKNTHTYPPPFYSFKSCPIPPPPPPPPNIVFIHFSSLSFSNILLPSSNKLEIPWIPSHSLSSLFRFRIPLVIEIDKFAGVFSALREYGICMWRNTCSRKV